jgi:hypothetical protein
MSWSLLDILSLGGGRTSPNNESNGVCVHTVVNVHTFTQMCKWKKGTKGGSDSDAGLDCCSPELSWHCQ